MKKTILIITILFSGMLIQADNPPKIDGSFWKVNQIVTIDGDIKETKSNNNISVAFDKEDDIPSLVIFTVDPFNIYMLLLKEIVSDWNFSDHSWSIIYRSTTGSLITIQIFDMITLKVTIEKDDQSTELYGVFEKYIHQQ